MPENRLARETSPYLRQHKDNPVHWQPWDADALGAAQRDGKPILLSIGYAACHWCHVMAHESFENKEIAGLMNELFVNIKVDREERPDLDAVYQAALHMLGEHGGWPLTMFLTPAGEPFWGGTYFPPEQRWGRPGFPDILRTVAEVFRVQPDRVRQNVTALKEGLQALGRAQGGGMLTLSTLNDVAATALRLVDPLHGGTGGAPKFPQASFFRMIWRAYARTGSALFRTAVTTTLDNICQGGIYDHLGGGFARYATDEVWLVPHFEKMLYDNALLIELLTEAWQGTRSELYAARVRETIGWLLTDMKAGAGNGSAAPFAFAFASAFDADSEGEEGKFYVWSAEEIDAALGPDAVLFREIYEVTPQGNWEGHNILNRNVAKGLSDPATEATLADARSRLLTLRNKRVPPGRDDKVLSDWNGMAIAALAFAGATFAEPAWIEAAETAFAFVRERMGLPGGRLRHVWCDGRARHPGVLDDYAQMARAALALYETTGKSDFLDQARTWIAAADAHHRDSADGGYFLSADDTADVIQRTKPVHDNATPSGNGTLAEVVARLYHVTGETAYRDRAEALVKAFVPEQREILVAMPTLLCAFEYLARPVQIVVAGPPGDPATDALLTAAQESLVPARVLFRLGPDASLPTAHPAAGKGTVDGQPAVYICVGETCDLPITDPEALRARLSAR